jgi:spermidine/putrescine ABC transporter ATP-binding subunit
MFGASLEINNLTKIFGRLLAVDQVSLKVRSGEFLTLLGPSGCGKTTTLMMIAGFILPSDGKILIDNKDITLVPPHKRNVGMVFQNYALFPHMTVFKNISFSLRIRRTHREVLAKEVSEALNLVQLNRLADRYPHQLSGGQQQRVALARALVFRPRVLLMDEPLGALDKKLREHMQLEIKHLQQTLNMTVIYVTHDQDEALTMSDRIAVLNSGRIEQLGSPKELYESPQNRFVADFIGESNFLHGKIVNIGESYFLVRLEDQIEIQVPFQEGFEIGQEVNLTIRPERILFRDGNKKLSNYIPAVVQEVIYTGESTQYIIRIGLHQLIKIRQPNRPSIVSYQVGQSIEVGWNSGAMTII